MIIPNTCSHPNYRPCGDHNQGECDAVGSLCPVCAQRQLEEAWRDAEKLRTEVCNQGLKMEAARAHLSHICGQIRPSIEGIRHVLNMLS